MNPRSLPTSLYIHIPWCVKKCPYCDFNSHTSETLPEKQYLDALLHDLAQEIEAYQIDHVESIFIGGGTPSLMSGSFYTTLLNEIRRSTTLAPNAEITMEANPGTTDSHKFTAFRQAGINRLSIGVQSFNDRHLKQLGRIHDGHAAASAIQQALKADFKQINLDLMFGLPHQSTQEALEDLEQAAAFGTSHLSWYQLTIEPNTHFYRQRPPLPEDDAVADLYEQGRQYLQAARFRQYELSAYTQTTPCQHNLNYWQFGDYIGIGAGAHGKITQVSEHGLNIIRTQKTRMPKDYLSAFQTNKIQMAHAEQLVGAQPERISQQRGKKTTLIEEEDHLIEFLLNALRVREGFNLASATERTNLSPTHITASLEKAFDLFLLEKSNGQIVPTERGWNHINAILEMVL